MQDTLYVKAEKESRILKTDDEVLSSKMLLFRGIYDQHGIYLDHFGKIASVTNRVVYVFMKTLVKEINKLFPDLEILYRNSDDNSSIDSANEILYVNKPSEILFHVDRIGVEKNATITVQVYYNCNSALSEAYAFRIITLLKKYSQKAADPRYLYYILPGYRGGLSIRKSEFESYKVNLDLNYNDDFKEIHKKIKESINSKGSGIHLLHGKPGTGKSSYIKFLIEDMKDKQFIYCPSNMVSHLSSPEFLELMLTEAKDSILIIEDAEEALVNDGQRTAAISNLLNISDGLLGDALNIKIIATYNVDKQNIDKALTRKGRLVTSYEFDLLSIDKATELAKHLEIDLVVEEAMSLADIYNHEQPEYEQKKKKIGIG